MNYIQKNKDNLIVGIIASLIPGIIILLISTSLFQNETKSIGIKVDYVTPLVEKQAEEIENINITIDNVRIENPYLSFIKIINTGTLPLLKTDFEKPIEISVGDNAKIVKAIVTETDPPGISSKVTWNDNTLMFQPTLLNSKDTVFIKILTSTDVPIFKATGRITGIKNIYIEERPYKREVFFKIISFAILALVSLTAGFLALNPFDFWNKFVVLNKRSSWFIFIILILFFSFSIENFLENIGEPTSFKNHIILYTIACPVALIFSFFMNRSTQKMDQHD